MTDDMNPMANPAPEGDTGADMTGGDQAAPAPEAAPEGDAPAM